MPAMTPVEACADLAVAGVSDWRLPSMKELQTIEDDTRKDPAIDTTAFQDTGVLDSFWSSSPHPAAGHLWIVQFNSGVTPGGEAYELYRTRCVR